MVTRRLSSYQKEWDSAGEIARRLAQVQAKEAERLREAQNIVSLVALPEAQGEVLHPEDKELLRSFFVDLSVRKSGKTKISQTTLDGYMETAEMFCTWTFAHGLPPISGIKGKHIDAWTYGLASGDATRSGRPAAQSSVKHHFAQLFQFFRWWTTEEDEENPKLNPMANLERPDVDDAPKEPPSPEDISLALFYLEKARKWRDFVVVALFYDTGMRASQLANLQSEDIHLSLQDGEGEVTLRAKGLAGKGSKGRFHRVRIGARTVKGIDRYMRSWPKGTNGLPKTPKYFIQGERYATDPETGKSIKKMTASGLYHLVRAVFKEVGVEMNVGPHLLRHALATHASADDMMDGSAVQNMLGHSKLETSDIYRKPALERRAMRAHARTGAGVDGLPAVAVRRKR